MYTRSFLVLLIFTFCVVLDLRSMEPASPPSDQTERAAKKRKRRRKRKGIQCAVCTERLGDESIATLKCKTPHYFHLRCLNRWCLRPENLNQQTCPLCRKDVNAFDADAVRKAFELSEDADLDDNYTVDWLVCDPHFACKCHIIGFFSTSCLMLCCLAIMSSNICNQR